MSLAFTGEETRREIADKVFAMVHRVLPNNAVDVFQDNRGEYKLTPRARLEIVTMLRRELHAYGYGKVLGGHIDSSAFLSRARRDEWALAVKAELRSALKSVAVGPYQTMAEMLGEVEII